MNQNNYLQELDNALKFVERDAQSDNTRIEEIRFLRIFKRKIKLQFGIPHQQVKNILLNLKKEYLEMK